MLSIDVSWRVEDGINRAYAWLSDGRVLGYRDLTTGRDVLVLTEFLDAYSAAMEEWLETYGVPSARIGPPPAAPLPPTGWGPIGWWRRRRHARAEASRIAQHREWVLDRPTWRVPIDPPHGGWRDLVRNDAGSALWDHAATQMPASWHDWEGYRRSRAWRVGAMGEESVGGELWHLSRSTGGAWRYVHSVPVGARGSDIDHVLVGPAGVFTINTKAHVGSKVWVAGNTFMVNGHRQPYVRNSQFEAERSARLLARATSRAITVRALIVVVDPMDLTVRETPDNVVVTTRWQFRRWIAAQPQVLSAHEVEVLFDAIRRSSTWSAATGTGATRRTAP